MTISIRNAEADELARRLAQLDSTSITEAVLTALREAIERRRARETPTETARRILARHGVAVTPAMRRPLDADTYRDLDHDLTEPS